MGDGAEGGVIRVNSLVVLISMVPGGDRYNWYSPLGPVPCYPGTGGPRTPVPTHSPPGKRPPSLPGLIPQEFSQWMCSPLGGWCVPGGSRGGIPWGIASCTGGGTPRGQYQQYPGRCPVSPPLPPLPAPTGTVRGPRGRILGPPAGSVLRYVSPGSGSPDPHPGGLQGGSGPPGVYPR